MSQIFKATRPTEQMFLSSTPDELAERFKLMIVGGRKLSDPEAKALAQYCISTGANPGLGEAYYIPGVGPGPGVAFYRRKASEQLWMETDKAKLPPGQYYFEHFPATNDDANFDREKGDIAWRVVLHDTYTRTLWEKRVMGHFITLISEKAGEGDNAMAIAKELVGPEPTWYAIGVVDHRERFAKDGKPEMWDRNERAQKRAEKLCLKKRFNINVPEPTGWIEDDIIDGELQDMPKERKGEAQLLAELGYDSEVKPDPTYTLEAETGKLGLQHNAPSTDIGYAIVAKDETDRIMQDVELLHLTGARGNPPPEPEGGLMPVDQAMTQAAAELELPKELTDEQLDGVGRTRAVDAHIDRLETQQASEPVYEPPDRYTPKQVKENIPQWAAHYKGENCMPRHRNLLAATWEACYEGDAKTQQTKRYEASKWLTGFASTKDIPADVVLALLKTWLGVTGWNTPPDNKAIAEARAVLVKALESAGQQSLDMGIGNGS